MKILKEIFSWIMNLFVAFAIAILINVFVFQQTYVIGRSMEPTLVENDTAIIIKLINTFDQEPEYGDIVVIDSRVDSPRTFINDLSDSLKNNLITYFFLGKEMDDRYWIKRVIGKSGDTIEFKNDQVIRNGKVLEEPYIKEKAYYSDIEKVIVPDNHVFVMGDNRNHSKDSRAIGPVPIDHIIGKYKFKY